MSNKFTPEEIKEHILYSLEVSCGDNLERCKMSFANKTETEMQEEFGIFRSDLSRSFG